MEEIEFAEGSFVFDLGASGAAFEASTGRKWAYRGRYHSFGDEGEDRQGVPAIAVYSCRNNDTSLAREMTALGQGAHAGFGPALYAHADAPRPDDANGAQLEMAVEEDAGISLPHAFSGERLPGCRPVVLEPPDSPAGRRQTAKILFDVTCQVANMHRFGLHHHDLKAANVCVRSVGQDPWDIRATVIDFDHTMHASNGDYVKSTPAYYDLLFKSLPARSYAMAGRKPSSLERDLGCLAVIWCEVMHRKELVEYRYSSPRPTFSLSSAELSEVLGRKAPFFWYEDGVPRARKLDTISDLEPLAEAAGLQRADELSLPPAVQREASLFKCGRYLDAECLAGLMSAHERNLGTMEDSIARAIFDNYNAHLVADGDRVKHPDFDTQPADLRQSNYAQAAGYVSHIWRLGYELVSADRCAPADLVDEFSPGEIGKLARWEHERWLDERLRTGWRYGQTEDGRSDHGRRISPSIIPFDELSPKMQEYDARPMREMIDILSACGLGVRKRTGEQRGR